MSDSGSASTPAFADRCAEATSRAMSAASPGRDQPGSGIEGHAALVAVVAREQFAQALDGASCLAVTEAREGCAGVLKPFDNRERSIDVVSIEDRLTDVLEVNAIEAGALE